MRTRMAVLATFISLAAFLEPRIGLCTNLNESLAIRAVLMESGGEGYTGMLAVAEAIRNRGSLKGVVGAKVHRYESPKLWDLAKKAWLDSIHTNTVKGATNWENVKQFGMPKWAKKMELVCVIGNHHFFKPKKSVLLTKPKT